MHASTACLDTELQPLGAAKLYGPARQTCTPEAKPADSPADVESVARLDDGQRIRLYRPVKDGRRGFETAQLVVGD